MPSIAQACNVLPTGHGIPMQAALEALRADLSTLTTAFNVLVAKLNLDAGVTDANYAAVGAMTATA